MADTTKTLHSSSEDIATVAIQRSLRPLPENTALTEHIIPESSELGRLLCSRKSERFFSGAAIPQEKIERLLADCAGGIRYSRSQDRSDVEILYRTIPQSGAICCVEVYFALMRETSHLSAGLYRFSAFSNTIHSVNKNLDIDNLKRIMNCSSDPFFEKSSAVFFITVDFETKTFKYGTRGIRYALIETGCALQNAMLSCCDQGIAAYPYGGFDDEALSQLLDLSPPNQAPIITMILGMPEKKA
jgi:SagB-type dehydrogenase family enzyme